MIPLVANSLLAADLRDETAQYRLSDTTRLYAFNKLRSTAEPPEAARCHAEYYCGLFAHAEKPRASRASRVVGHLRPASR